MAILRPEPRSGNRRTLAIGNLTGSGAGTHPHSRISRADSCQWRATTSRSRREAATPNGAAPARPVRQAAADDHSAGHDRRHADLRAGDRQLPRQPAQRPARRGQHRRAGARCRAARAWCRRRWRGRSCPASARARSPSRWASSAACSPAPTCRRTIDHDIDMRNITVWAAIYDAFEMMLETRQPRDPRHRQGAGRGAVHRGRDRRAAAAPGDVPLLAQRACGVAADRGPDVAAGLPGAALSVRAADAAAHRQSRRLPRKSGKSGAHHRAEPARRRDRRRRARIVRHAARPRVDAASEEPARSAGPRRLQDQPRSAQPAGVLAAAVGPARQRARSARAALCAEADALAGARDRLLPVDAVLRPRAGGRRPTAASCWSSRW